MRVLKSSGFPQNRMIKRFHDLKTLLVIDEQMIDQFKQAFLEEAREILAELESALLELNENRSDRELVGRAFRALHTAKVRERCSALTNLQHSLITLKPPSMLFAMESFKLPLS